MYARLYVFVWLAAWHCARLAVWLYPKLVG